MITTTNKSKPKNGNTNVRMKVLKCENCGAPITPDAVGCEYCGSSFVIEEENHVNIKKDVRNVKCGIMTPNEARRMMGLESIWDDVRTFHEEMKYIREGPNTCGVYDTDGNRIKTLTM